jgi:hypothetical protein
MKARRRGAPERVESGNRVHEWFEADGTLDLPVHNTRGDAQRRSDLLETFFTIVRINAPRKKRKCIDTPSDAQQRARTCACSGELVAYVRAMGNRTGSEFDRIRTFLTSTEQGAALLAAAGIADAFELDHYVPECLGGPSVVENAHVMPRNGDNQYFRDAWDMRKCRYMYCGESTSTRRFDASHPDLWTPVLRRGTVFSGDNANARDSSTTVRSTNGNATDI